MPATSRVCQHPPMRRPATLVLTLTVLAFAGVTTWVGAISGAPPQFLVADAAGGLTFLAAGTIAMVLRPASPAGPALALSSALWFVGSYGPTGQPVVTDLGFAFEGYYDLVLAWLLLGLTGGVGSRSRPALIALGAAMALRSVGRLVFKDPASLGCPDCPPNPFSVLGSVAAFETTEILANAAICGLALAIGIIAIRRLAGQSSVARQSRAPILVAGTLAMAGAAFDAAEYAWSMATGMPLVSLPEPASEVFAWAVFALRVLVPIAFLVATLRVRGRAGALAPLAAGLGPAGTSPRDGGASIGAALRATLGDPSLELVTSAPDGTWRREDGTRTTRPAGDETRIVTVIGTPEAPLALLLHDPALVEQPELLDGTARVLALALENQRLSREVQAQLAEVRASRARIVEAAQAERQRVERDLHDGAQQRLIGVLLALQQARSKAGEGGDALAAQLDAATDELNAAVRELRELARGIHPAILEEEGLGPAVAGLARRAALPVEVDVLLDERLPRLVETTAYFVIAEALTNAQRHARATEVHVGVRRIERSLHVEVRDDGTGGADPARGSGLRGLADRVTALSGRLEVDSAAGRGTRVLAEIPVP